MNSMIFMFTTRTWVPGCLGGRSRGAWAASPGSLGRLPGAPWGGPGPNSSAQNWASPLGFGIVFYINFDANSTGR